VATGTQHLSAYKRAWVAAGPAFIMLAVIVLWSSGQIWLTTVFTAALFAGYGLGYYITPDLALADTIHYYMDRMWR